MTETGRIAKYYIERRLGTGGMAEVFKCRLSGIGGFDKIVVVKRILPHLAEDDEFVAMFLDEARIAGNLNHPNVVQVYEIDQDTDGSPYIAMEFVKGPTFAQLIRNAFKAEQLQLPKMVKIIIGAAMGLDHAHNAKGANGEPLQIVHRDVSPHNIMVSQDGTPKILDFGVARADGRLTHTRGSSVKGKARFMAPEILLDPSSPIDRRADVFSLGVCLYMATTGAWPFNGASDSLIMESIASGQFKKPSERVREYPAELEEIIAWTLARDPNERCPSCRALAERLSAWLEKSRNPVTDKDISEWITLLFPEIDADTWGSGLYKTPTGLSTGPQVATGLKGARSGITPSPLVTPAHAAVARVTKTPLPVTEAAQTELAFAVHISESAMAMAGPKPPLPFTKLKVGLALAGLVLLGAFAFLLRSSPPPAQARPTIDAARSAVTAGKLSLAKELIEQARLLPLTPQDNADLAALRDSLKVSELLGQAEEAISERKFAEAALLIGSVEKLAPQSPEADALRAKLPHRPNVVTTASVDIEIERPAAAQREKSRAAPARATQRPSPSAAPSSLSVRSEPSGASVFVDGSLVGLTPMASTTIKPGAHTVAVMKKGFSRYEESVNAVGKPLSISARLVEEPALVAPAPAPVVLAPPRLRVTASVPARVIVDGSPRGGTPFDTESLSTGEHVVVVNAEGFEPVSKEIELKAAETKALHFELRASKPPPVVEAKKEEPPATRQPDPNGPIASCPEGASLFGNAPPEGNALWCAEPGGTRHGKYIRWYPNGRKAEQGEFMRGKKNGLWVEYFEDGTERERLTWRRGVKTW